METLGEVMTTFNKFVRDKNCQEIAELIVACDLDENGICESILDHARALDPNSPEVLNEFVGGMGNILGAARGGFGGTMAAGARAATRAIGAGARAAGGALKTGVNALGRGQQHLGNLYQQGELKNRLSRVTEMMKTVQSELGSMGFQDQQLDIIFANFSKKIQQLHQQASQDPNMRMPRVLPNDNPQKSYTRAQSV